MSSLVHFLADGLTSYRYYKTFVTSNFFFLFEVQLQLYCNLLLLEYILDKLERYSGRYIMHTLPKSSVERGSSVLQVDRSV